MEGMKTGWVIVASLGAVSVMAFIIAMAVIRRQNRVGDVGGADDVLARLDPGGLCQCTDIAKGGIVGPGEALEAIMSVAAAHPEYRQAWEGAVRSASDEVAGEIAGRQMAGRFSGELEWHAAVPMPMGMDPVVGHAAFDIAVRDEVMRRITAMNGPGAFG